MAANGLELNVTEIAPSYLQALGFQHVPWHEPLRSMSSLSQGDSTRVHSLELHFRTEVGKAEGGHRRAQGESTASPLQEEKALISESCRLHRLADSCVFSYN